MHLYHPERNCRSLLTHLTSSNSIRQSIRVLCDCFNDTTTLNFTCKKEWTNLNSISEGATINIELTQGRKSLAILGRAIKNFERVTKSGS